MVVFNITNILAEGPLKFELRKYSKDPFCNMEINFQTIGLTESEFTCMITELIDVRNLLWPPKGESE